MPEQNGIAVEQTQLGGTEVKPVDPRRATFVDFAIRAIQQEATSLPSSKALDSEVPATTS
jgi:hypothetical protein